MSAEKTALKRFLALYLISTVLLVSIGEWFYYKLAKKEIIQKEKLVLKNQINEFLNKNPRLIRVIRGNSFNIPEGIKVLIYINDNLVFSNSSLLDLKEEYLERKGWRKIKIVTTKEFPYEKLNEILKRLLIFNLFFLLFLVTVSVFLGKIFLAPLKKVINNLEEFIRDATHEMNTPLSIILTNIELLDEENKPIKRIKNAALRLNKIFEDLKYVRLYHKRKKEIKRIKLKKFLQQRIRLFESIIENKNLFIEIDADEVCLEIDREDLIRLFDNLLSNAFKYAPKHSTVKITLNKNFFCIKNEGEIKNINKLTHKFYRENKSEGGFGLGLYIVKTIGDEYSFKLKIENQNKKVNICLYFV
ncbi:MAG: HAMP domain-containing sensor histidine kinase [Nautiliaceae bacterium]